MEPAAALDHTPVTELFAVPVGCHGDFADQYFLMAKLHQQSIDAS
jgi:hypothetical protein